VTTGEMLAFINRFKEIINGSSELKFSRLKALSDDLLTYCDMEDDIFTKQMLCTVVEEMYS
jgi:hypothetical protein